MSGFPLRYAHENVLVGRGDTRAALYRVDTISYPFLAGADKRAWLGRLARFAFSVRADFSLWRVCRAYPGESYVEQAMDLLDERSADPEVWREFLSGHEGHLRRLRPFVPEVYVAVSLAAEARGGLGADFVRGLDRARRRLEELFGVADRVPVAASEIEALVEAEERVFRLVGECLPARRASTEELQWLLRRAACRGVGEPVLDRHWRPNALLVESEAGALAYEPLDTSVLRLVSDPVTEHDRSLVVESEAGTSHQALLTVGALPEETVFPGGAELLCAPFEAVGFPVDAVVHARWVANRDAVAKVRRRIVDADNAYAEQLVSEHGPLSYATEENRSLARELDAYLQGHERPPLLKVAMSLAVGAPDAEELDHRVEALRHQFGTTRLERPLGMQPALYADHFVRPDGGRVSEHADVLTVEQFGALMVLGSNDVGSVRGPLIGRAVGGGLRPVKLDITEASRTGRPPSMLLAGTLGSGKTIAAQLIVLLAALRGSQVVDVDPKPDHNLEGLPELAGRVQSIELEAGERHRGVLDPLVVAPAALREDLTSSYLSELLPSATPEWQTQIRKAVRQVLAEPDASCLRVLDVLRASRDDHARAAGEALGVWAESGLAKLAFGDGSRARLASELQVTTIKARGLSLPAPGVARSDYDEGERLSVATLRLIAAYAMRLVAGDRSRHKVVLFDEAWFLLASRDGRRLVDRLNRLGRAENATLILATQQLADVGEIESLIGTRLIFGQETAAEARRALELLGLDADDRELVERLRSYRKGRCLMRDISDRVAEVQIDPVLPHVLGVLDTTPARQRLEIAA